jgi:hypothetical protein
MIVMGLEKVLCEECEGEGTISIGPECSYPASMCCGGCYEDVDCKECDGVGFHYIEVEEEEDY